MARIRPRPAAERVLGEVEGVVPEPRLEMALELGQVEVRARAGGAQPLGAMEHVEAEVEQPGRHRLAVDEDVLLEQVPAARPDEQRGDLVVQAVLLLARVERDRALDRVDQVRLALDAIRPGGRVRILEVGHEHLRAGVERVDHHLPIDRPRDLDAAVLEVGGRLGDAPRAVLADVLRLREEVGQPALVDLGLSLRRSASSSSRRGPSSRWSVATNSRASDVRMRSAAGPASRQNVDTRRDRRRHGHRLTRVGLPRAFVEAVEAALPGAALLTEPEELRTYECDGLTGRRVIPALVCLPQTTDEVQAVVRACAAHRIPFVARGAGTGLSGGALPVAEGIVISLARMNRVLDVDLDAERVVVSPA